MIWVKKTIYLFVAPLLIICFFISCNSNAGINDDILKEDMAFVQKIENILSIGYGKWDYLKNLEEFLYTEINLIIRGEVIAREESAITAFGIPLYPNEDLRSENYEYARSARNRITTPYKIKINEVYHGDINKEGDIITLYALYGIVDGFESKFIAEEPIYNVGAEYIMFLRVENNYENIVYISSMSLLKLDTTNGTFESLGVFGNIYSKYENNTDKFVADLKDLIKNNNYSTEVKVHGSKEDLQEIIDQMNRERAEDGLNTFIPDILEKK